MIVNSGLVWSAFEGLRDSVNAFREEYRRKKKLTVVCMQWKRSLAAVWHEPADIMSPDVIQQFNIDVSCVAQTFAGGSYD